MTLKLSNKTTRWDRWGFVWRVSLFFIAISLISFLILTAQESNEGTSSSNISVFLLVNLNILILLILAIVIIRNIVRLIFEWKKNILGSKLKVKLVAAFVGITLIPTAVLFFFASGLLNQAMEGWFSTQVESSIEGAVTVSRRHFALVREIVEEDSQKAKNIILRNSQDKWQKQIEDFRQSAGIFSIVILQGEKEILRSENANASIDGFIEPPFDVIGISKANSDKTITLSESHEAARFIRTYQQIILDGKKSILIVSQRIDPELSEAFDSVSDSFAGYEQLKLHRHPIRSGYLLTLTLLTGLILFGAVWVAFYIARQIVVPIERLAKGTTEVAKGNYDVKIQGNTSDEMGMLISSFNQMLKDLKTSRVEGESRKLLLETSFANLAVGVISLDRDQNITSINHVAKKLFSVDKETSGKISEVFKSEDFQRISPLLYAIERGENAIEKNIELVVGGRTASIVCTAGRIANDSNKWVGTLMLFDDITELKKAQQMSAWREVARRIAHEIKNPLTPIQLSAQRLQKISLEHPDESRIKECAEIIVENVDSIKRLANEFSNFARMPEVELKEGSLNTIVSDLVTMFAGNHNEVTFQLITDNSLPTLQVDIEQVRRMLINLFDNAIDALKNYHEDKDFLAKIEVRTIYDSNREIAILEISDNGPGIEPENTLKIMEPYFTTKEEGTGLGLAIVMSIVTDHHGTIKVFKNKPHGAKFVIEIPLHGKGTTQRRLTNPV